MRSTNPCLRRTGRTAPHARRRTGSGARLALLFASTSAACHAVFPYAGGSTADRSAPTDGAPLDRVADAGDGAPLDAAQPDELATGDASAVDQALADAAMSLPTSLSAPQLVATGAATSMHYRPWLSRDGLRLYFSSNRPGSVGGWDIWIASRASTATMSFGAAQVLAGTASANDDGDPWLMPDELTVYFNRAVNTSSPRHLVCARRMTRDTPFGSAQTIPELDSGNGEYEPTLTDDELEIIFTSDRSAMTRLWTATRKARTDPFGAPTLAAGIEGRESLAASLASPFVLVFEGHGPDTSGGADVYGTTRPARDAPWAPPTRLDALASSSYDQDPFVHTGLRLVLFTSTRSGASQIYWASF